MFKHINIYLQIQRRCSPDWQSRPHNISHTRISAFFWACVCYKFGDYDRGRTTYGSLLKRISQKFNLHVIWRYRQSVRDSSQSHHAEAEKSDPRKKGYQNMYVDQPLVIFCAALWRLNILPFNGSQVLAIIRCTCCSSSTKTEGRQRSCWTPNPNPNPPTSPTQNMSTHFLFVIVRCVGSLRGHCPCLADAPLM